MFRALVRWQPKYSDLEHPEFRRLLAHAMLTGGASGVNSRDGIDVDAPPPPTPSRCLEEGRLWMSFAARDKKEGGEGKQSGHRCGFCLASVATKKATAFGFCAACSRLATTKVPDDTSEDGILPSPTLCVNGAVGSDTMD